MQFWEGVPTFTAEQIMSANGHLNALARAVQYLADMEMASTMPFSGILCRDFNILQNWTTIWTGYIRHKQDTLRYSFIVYLEENAHPYVRVQFDGVTVAEQDLGTLGADTHSFTFTADISGAGLNVGQFYTVTFVVRVTDASDSDNYIWLRLIREDRTANYPSLIDFNDSVVPTAAQWQALSDYAQEVYNELNSPRIVFSGQRSSRRTYNYLPIWYGAFRHRNRYLYYQIRLKKSAGLRVRIHLMDEQILELARENTDPDPVDQKLYSGTVDLDGIGAPPAIGALYRLKVTLNQGEDTYSQVDKAKVEFLCEQESVDDNPSLPSWNALPTWEQADYVAGSSGSKRVQWIKQNLQILGGQVLYQNMACRQNQGNPHQWGRRLHRWLHYRNAEGERPSLQYLYDEKREVSLPDASGEWMTYDLDAAEGLWLGTRYQITHALAAIEDSVF